MITGLNLTTEDIERLVKETILKSGFGKAVETAIEKALTGYNSPVDEAVKQFVARTVREVLDVDPWRTKIREAVERAIAAKVTTETLDTVASKSVEAIVNAAEKEARGW